MNDDLILQIYFQSDRPRRDAILATDVDIIQFARNVASVAQVEEHRRCMGIVARINADAATALGLMPPTGQSHPDFPARD